VIQVISITYLKCQTKYFRKYITGDIHNSVRREKICEVFQHFQIPNKLIRLVQATTDNIVAKVKPDITQKTLAEKK
jgi:hypothetical protein